MRIKPKTAYESMGIYYNISVVNLLQVSANFYCRFREVLYKGYNIKISKSTFKYQNIQNAFQDCDTSNTT